MTHMKPNRTSAAGSTRSIVLLLADECQASAVLLMLEVLCVANIQAARAEPAAPPVFRWQLLSPSGGKAVHAMGGATLIAEGSLSEAGRVDAVFVPGLHFDGDVQRLQRRIEALTDDCGSWLAEQYRKGAVLAASCSGVFVLARAGLLDGRRATTSWFLGGLFRASFDQVRYCQGELVACDGRLFSSGAFSATLDLALQIVEHFAGPALALACAKVMLIDPNRDSQFPYMTLQARARHSDKLVLRAQSRVRSRVREQVSVEDLARRLGVTARTLNRRFHEAIGCSPIEYLQEVRIEGAKRLLETSGLTLEQIMERVGYQDPSSFRRLFERMTKVSPSRYRRMFGRRDRRAAESKA
jgi:transcriptional regulator GlxA family with amidase domain